MSCKRVSGMEVFPLSNRAWCQYTLKSSPAVFALSVVVPAAGSVPFNSYQPPWPLSMLGLFCIQTREFKPSALSNIRDNILFSSSFFSSFDFFQFFKVHTWLNLALGCLVNPSATCIGMQLAWECNFELNFLTVLFNAF